MIKRRRRDKELTKEQALELARQELRPQWHGSEPLLAATRVGSEVKVFPLTEDTFQRPWILIFTDPMTPDTRYVTDYSKEWHRRFQDHGIGFLLVLRSVFDLHQDPQYLKKLNESLKIPFSIVRDEGGLLAQAFEVKKYPQFAFFHKGSIPFRTQSPDSLFQFENEIQKFLRLEEPGYPFPPPYCPPTRYYFSSNYLNCGSTLLKKPLIFPTSTSEREVLAALNAAGPGVLAFQGVWKQTPHAMETQDPDALIRFNAQTGNISIGAGKTTAEKSTADPGKIVVEANGRAILEEFRSANLQIDDGGDTYAPIQQTNLYFLTQGLPQNYREFTLKFPYAKRLPLSIYGIHFGEETQFQGAL